MRQCNRDSGRCVCRKGIGGDKCNQCDRGHIGAAPDCSPCGECFDNWDLALDELKNQTTRAIDEASRIQKVGTTGVYSQEFNDMEASLDHTRAIIDNTSVKSQDLDELNDLAKVLTDKVEASAQVLKDVRQELDNVNERVNSVDIQLKTYKKKASELHQSGLDLQTKANKLQEADVQGGALLDYLSLYLYVKILFLILFLNCYTLDYIAVCKFTLQSKMSINRRLLI